MMQPRRRSVVCLVALAAAILAAPTDAFSTRPLFAVVHNERATTPTLQTKTTTTTSIAAANDGGEEVVTNAPTLNGKMVLPFKVMSSGLKDHQVAAVYAILNSQYKRGSGDGWEQCEYVGVTRDLDETLQSLLEEHGKDAVSHVRALSFSFPQADAMAQVASDWRDLVRQAGGTLQPWVTITEVYDDDEEEEWLMETAPPPPQTTAPTEIVSPFAANQEGALAGSAGSSSGSDSPLAFTRENVDKILEEVRPYLISDGGNVAVDRVDEENKNVYLIMEGACGSCASSTVTMQMGIERVLKENFPDLGEVIEIEDPNAPPAPTELTWEAVEAEVNRIKPAIIAMGGVVEIKSVDPIGVVELEFRGGNKLKKGVELAVQDVPYVKHVKFVM